jgi:hypothetical protein
MNTARTDTQLAESLETPLAALHNLLLQELERQETIRAICRAQRQAAIEGDAPTLEDLTRALTEHLSEAQAAETRRFAVLRELVDALRLAPEHQTLTGLIRAMPSAWQPAFAELQQRLRSVLEDTRRVLRTNRRFFASSARGIEESLSVAVGANRAAEGRYTDRGESGAAAKASLLLNARG